MLFVVLCVCLLVLIYVEFRCHIVCIMLTRVGGKKRAAVGLVHVVCSGLNVWYVCSVGVGEGVVYERLYGRGGCWSVCCR
jgi:hypothetical protein